jgi:hypothetical protein
MATAQARRIDNLERDVGRLTDDVIRVWYARHGILLRPLGIRHGNPDSRLRR